MFDVHCICMKICAIIHDYFAIIRDYCDYSRCFYMICIRIVLKLVRNILFAFASFRNLAPQTSLVPTQQCFTTTSLIKFKQVIFPT